MDYDDWWMGELGEHLSYRGAGVGSVVRYHAVRGLAKAARAGSTTAVGELARALNVLSDRRVRRAAAHALRSLPPGPSSDALCRLVIEQENESLLTIAREAGYLPTDPEQRVVFLALSGQWDTCEECDFGWTSLRSAYEAASPDLRRRLANAARSAGRTEWMEVAVGGNRRLRLAEMAADEWKAVLEPLRGREYAARAWRLAQEAPPLHGRELLLNIADADALPAHDRHGYTRLRTLAESCKDNVPFGSAGALSGATLRGHNKAVCSLAVTPDSSVLASGSAGETIRLWDLPSGEHAATLPGHKGGVYALAVSPDGELLASASYDKTIRLWHLPGGKPCGILRGHKDWVYSLAITPGNALLASASRDKTIRLWHLPYGEPAATLRGRGEHVYRVAVTPDGGLLASTASDKSIHLWHLPTGEPAAAMSGHEDPSGPLVITPDGALLCSGSGDNTVCLWHLPAGKPAAVLPGHSGGVRSLAVTPDGALLASAGSDKTIRLWHLPGGEPAATLTGHYDWVNDLAFTPDGTLLVSGGGETIRLWTSEIRILADTPVAELARQHDHIVTLSRTPGLTASARAWLDFMFALVDFHRRFDIEVEVVDHVEVGEFDIEIGS